MFCSMTKKSKQKFIYLTNKKSFWGEIKNIFHIFDGLSVAKNVLRPEIEPFNDISSDLKNSSDMLTWQNWVKKFAFSLSPLKLYIFFANRQITDITTVIKI